MNINGASFSNLFNIADGGVWVNKGGILILQYGSIGNNYRTLQDSTFAAYVVPASFKYVIIGYRALVSYSSTAVISGAVGYGTAATTSAAPAGNVEMPLSFAASVAGNINSSNLNLDVPAGGYPYFRGNAAGIGIQVTLFGYLQAV